MQEQLRWERVGDFSEELAKEERPETLRGLIASQGIELPLKPASIFLSGAEGAIRIRATQPFILSDEESAHLLYFDRGRYEMEGLPTGAKLAIGSVIIVLE